MENQIIMKQRKKLQIADNNDALRTMLDEIAKYHKDNNPSDLDAEAVRLFGIHGGIRAALVHCIRKEYNWIKSGAHPPIKAC